MVNALKKGVLLTSRIIDKFKFYGEIKRVTKEDVINLITNVYVTFIAKEFSSLSNYVIKVLNLIEEEKIKMLHETIKNNKTKNSYFLTPIETKGREYNDVVVFTKRMDKIDKYITFTRSKNNLYT